MFRIYNELIYEAIFLLLDSYQFEDMKSIHGVSDLFSIFIFNIIL